MRVTVLGGCAAWPAAGQACSGYLVEHGGFRLLVDPGYAILPRLLQHMQAEQVDAVLVTHGHPDHCADLHPLLRARVLGGQSPPLPVHALPGAVDAVLALDEPEMLAGSYELHDLRAGDPLTIGPLGVNSASLPHFVPDVGVQLVAGDRTLAYTGDCAPDEAVVTLARDVDVLLAEATYPDEVPERQAAGLTSARDAGRQAAEAGARRLVLTHLWPGVDPGTARRAAASVYSGPIDVAVPGLVVDLSG